MRPRPGAGRRTIVDPVRPRAAAPASSDLELIPNAARALLGLGLNPLVRAASPLLLLMAQMRETISPMDVPGLRRYALEEIRQFEEQARSSGVSNEIVLAARYVLCACLDEAVLSTPWGNQSEWAQHPLLVALHREAWGGEKFFDMLDRISQDPSRYIDLMELQYLGIAFGFAGKYQVQERGHEHLLGVQQDLYRKIRNHRGPTEPALSLRWRGLESRQHPLLRYLPWWVVAAAALPILASRSLYAANLASAPPLARRGEPRGPSPPRPIQCGPTFETAPGARRRTARSAWKNRATAPVTPRADLFPSGSARSTRHDPRSE